MLLERGCTRILSLLSSRYATDSSVDLHAKGSWNAGDETHTVKTTKYFEFIRQRPDRALIRDEWIERVIRHPVREVVQQVDGFVGGHR